MKHNNQLAKNTGFRKDWQFYVKTHLDQAARKQKRRDVRKQKAIAKAPAPLGLFRPAVHCPTQRYNMKVRVGRGFTLEELKGAGLSVPDARARGIAVDYRRRNRSEESLQLNVARLKGYLARLVIAPKPGEVAKREAVQPNQAGLAPKKALATEKITEDLRKKQVVRLAKQLVATHKLEGKRRFKKEEKDDEKPAKDGDAGGDDE